MPITVTPHPETASFFLFVDYVAPAGTQTSATLYRGLSATGPWQLLDVLTLTGQQAGRYDNAAPLDTDVWWRTVANDGTEIIAGPFSIASEEDVIWLKDPARPWADIRVGLCDTVGAIPACDPGLEVIWVGFGDFVRRMDAGLFDILNQETAADVYGRRKNHDGEINFATLTLAAKQRAYELFTAGGPILVQAPPVYGVPPIFIQPFDLTEAWKSRDQRVPYRLWSSGYRTVDEPIGPTQGTACANWCAVEEFFPTFGDMVSTNTWLDLLEGDVLCPGGEPADQITDTFTRTVVDAWGVADTGQAWTNTGGAAANYDVNGTTGTHTHSVIGTSMNSMIPFTGANVNERVDWSVDSTPLGNAYLIFMWARSVDMNNGYVARVRIGPTTNDMVITIRKRVAGVETQLSTFTTPFIYAANVRYTMRFEVNGSNLRAKVWPTLSAEPAGWQTTTTDPDFAAAGNVGVRTTPFAGVTNIPPITFSFDNFIAGP